MRTSLLLAIPSLVLLAVDVIAVILVIRGVRGNARILAVIGILVQVLVFVGSFIFNLLLPRLMFDLHLASSQVGLLSTIASLINAVIGAIGLVMIGLAIGHPGRRNRFGAPA